MRTVKPRALFSITPGVLGVPLTSCLVAIIDACDARLVSDKNWCAAKMTAHDHCAIRSEYVDGVRKTIYMHRVIIGAAPGEIVDHINRSALDNRRSNLRIVTRAQNAQNRRRNSNNTTGFRGVVAEKRRGKIVWYVAKATPPGAGRQVTLGRFNTPGAAARAYDTYVLRTRGEFAVTNF